ncbi:VOC family protein [Sphingopyxis terrae]|uniref:VOC family protein n=1 Tax=Sphingopyxis terrae TaxID=33052 RepID=UPI002A0FD188|nr:VOC family protein [Sphingopyxis terrae]MDX8358881.1 VOC family protein [Sphingopyxis terrae]
MAIAYITIGTNDMSRSRSYYDVVIPHLGGRLEVEYGDHACCHILNGDQRIWIGKPNDGMPVAPGNGIMPGFLCDSRAAVDGAHCAALAHGGTSEGDPGPRPLYGPDFYGAYARDTDGNQMSFVDFSNSQP